MLENATQEYILLTMYHESIHSFLRAENIRLGDTNFKEKYPDVNEYDFPYKNGTKVKKYQLLSDHAKFHSFVENLAQAARSFNPNFPLDRARALAKMGIVTGDSMTNDEKLLNDYERRDPNHPNWDLIKDLSKGQKCDD